MIFERIKPKFEQKDLLKFDEQSLKSYRDFFEKMPNVEVEKRIAGTSYSFFRLN